LFKETFGTAKVTLENIQKAFATFERTLTSGKRSNFDQFISGKSVVYTD
jgi:cytochrome c peroxidase